MKHSMSKRAGYCPEVDRGLTWIVTGQPSVDFIALNQIGNGCESVQRVPMIRIPVVGSLRNGRAGCNGPDRNGSRAAEPNEFDAGNVRSPDRGTRGGERRVEDPGGGSGSAAADQLAEPLETTINGQPATRSLRGKSKRKPGGQDGHRGQTLAPPAPSAANTEPSPDASTNGKPTT